MKSIKTKLRLKRNKSDYNQNRRITNKSLVFKLNQEGKIRNNIEKILLFKNPKVYKFNPKYERNKSEDNENQIYNETLQLINNYNKNFSKNIKSYKEKNRKKKLYVWAFIEFI